ncbi:MAG TPA: zinc ABC transporter substrate-binding protein [Ghiorsea sp.]|nr:zinc ABC transporter substrate-binding protein [Ghiorsea sp.]
MLLAYATRINKIVVNCNVYHHQQGYITLNFSRITCFFLLLFPSISHATSQQIPPVLVTLPPLSGLVLALSPDLNIQCLLPNNADPHHFQLTPRQVNHLQHATLLVRSPRDDQSWAMLQPAAPTFSLWQEHENTPDTLTDAHEHEHTDSHAWLNPKLVASELPHLAEALIQSNPANEQNIQKQLKRSQQQTKNTWQQWQDMVKAQQLKQRGVMMQHPSWRGLFEALGVPIRGVLESSQHGQEYGPRKLEKALQVLKEYPKTILIADSNHSNRALKWLQKHSSNTMIQLDALGACGEPWQHLMQRNLKTLSTLSVMP